MNYSFPLQADLKAIHDLLRSKAVSPQGPFRSKLTESFKRLDQSLAGLYLNGTDRKVMRRSVFMVQNRLRRHLENLAQMKLLPSWQPFLRKTSREEESGLTLFIISSIHRALLKIECDYRQYFDTDVKLPFLSHLLLLETDRKDLQTLKRLLRQGKLDEQLASLILNHLASFDPVSGMRYSFRDYHCFKNLISLLLPHFRHHAAESLTIRITKELIYNGFNMPDFVRYCMAYYKDLYFAGVQAEGKKEALYQIRERIILAGKNHLGMKCWPSLSEQLQSWIDQEIECYLDVRRLDKEIEKEVSRRLAQHRILADTSVDALGLLWHSSLKTGLYKDKKQQIANAVSLLIRTPGAEEISPHSFLNAMNVKYSKTAMLVIEQLKQMAVWIYNNTELKDFYNKGDQPWWEDDKNTPLNTP